MDILARKSERVGQVGGQVGVSGSWQAERGSRRTHGHPRRLPRKDPRAEVGEDVRVGIGVGPWNLSFITLYIVSLVKK